MQLFILLLGIAVLAGVAIGVFFWMQIKAERSAPKACMLCGRPVSFSTAVNCPNCGWAVCAECRAQKPSCPNCKRAFGT